MHTLTASSKYGFSGQYVARITGRDSKYTFAREFIGRKGGKRNEDTSVDVDEPGLYERCDVDKHGKSSTYCVLVDAPDSAKYGFENGTLRKVAVSKEDAMVIAKAMDANRDFAEIVAIEPEQQADGKYRYVYEVLSAKQAEKAQAAQTLDSAIAGCWSILEALPVKEAKKVLAALKVKLTPPNEPAPVAPAASQRQ